MYLRGVFIYLFFITINSLLVANSFDINFSHHSGYYTSAVNLIIETNASKADVFYCINKPITIGNLLVYESSIPIDSTCIINVMAILNEDTIYKSSAFLFLDDIKTSNNLSTHITEKEEYKNLIDSAFLSIPTVCINTAFPFSVIDTIGPKEVSSNIIFILPNHTTKSISIKCGLQTWGGSPSNPKKNYKLEFKSAYGPSKFNFDLFKSEDDKLVKAATKFDKLLLRAGSQDGLNAEYGNEAEAQYIKNRFVYDVVLELGLPAPHGFFTHVFINNKYAGVYHLMEAQDEFFFKTYFFNSYKKDSIEIRKNRGYANQPVNPTYYNTLLAYSNGLNSKSNYIKLSNFINIDATTSYITYHHFFNNIDWSDFQNTLLAAVPYKPDGKFELVPWDFDFSLGARGTFPNTYVYDRHGAVPENLFNSAEFKFLQGDKVVCYCNNDGILTKNNLQQLYNARATEIKIALIAEAAKWGDFDFDGSNINIDAPYWEPNLHWEDQRKLVNQYLTNRTDDFVEDYKIIDRLTKVLPVKVTHHEDGIRLTNPNNYGKIVYTLDGTDPRNFGGVLNPEAFIYADDDEAICIKKPANLIARVYVATNIDVRWSNFCPLKIYPEQAYNQLVINEIHYNPTTTDTLFSAKDYEFVELKNKSNNTIFLEDVEFNKGIQYKFDKIDSLRAGQLLILANDSAGFVSKYGFNANAYFKGSLNNEGELLSLIDPNGNIIDTVNFSSTQPWPELKETIESSIALINPSLNNQLASSWNISQAIYSPGLDNDFCSYQPLNLNTVTNNLSCFNKNDGTAKITINGGEQPYSILWNNGATSNKITNLAKGKYNVTVQDAFYCTTTTTIEILNPTDISINFVENFAYVIGGKPPYSYLWSNGETSKRLQADEPGDYQLIVTDANGCTKQKIKSIKNIPLCNNNVKPKALVTNNLTSTSVILFWNEVKNANYTIKYKTENEQTWHTYETKRTMAILYNLIECTTYYYTITFNCINNQSEVESESTSFETKGC